MRRNNKEQSAEQEVKGCQRDRGKKINIFYKDLEKVLSAFKSFSTSLLFCIIFYENIYVSMYSM